MKYGSLFDGIHGFGLGFERAGMTCAWRSENNKDCNALMGQRRPNIPNLGDVRNVGKHNAEPVDLICGGFPCQDLSVAGKRAGLAGERSGLWFEFHRIVAEMHPQWVVVENVPGLLSSNGGRDFAIILRGLVECGYRVAWRILDARYFGIAQRRRRVFIVASLGNGRCAEVLFELEGVSRDFAKGGTARERIAAPLTRGSANSSGVNETGRRREDDENIVVCAPLKAESPARRNGGSDPIADEFVIAFAWQQGTSAKGGREYIARKGDYAGSLSGTRQDAIAWHENKSGTLTLDNTAKALRSGASHSYQGVGVRRLTPTECERLQGFPDGWTDGFADSVRYRMLGNAAAVPVVEWIGNRIVEAK